MANEDVLERAGRFVNDELGAKFRTEVCSLVESLIAALREAREDTRRLDGIFASKDLVIQVFDEEDVDWAEVDNRDQLDAALAAMKPPGGEGSSHE